MERINFQAIEKKWQRKFAEKNLYREGKKNFTALKCFPTPLAKFIWDT